MQAYLLLITHFSSREHASHARAVIQHNANTHWTELLRGSNAPPPKRTGLVIANEFNLFHIWISLGLVTKLACFLSLSGHSPLSREKEVWGGAGSGSEPVCTSSWQALHTYTGNSNTILGKSSVIPISTPSRRNRSFLCIPATYANIKTLTTPHTEKYEGTNTGVAHPGPDSQLCHQELYGLERIISSLCLSSVI